MAVYCLMVVTWVVVLVVVKLRPELFLQVILGFVEFPALMAVDGIAMHKGDPGGVDWHLVHMFLGLLAKVLQSRGRPRRLLKLVLEHGELERLVSLMSARKRHPIHAEGRAG